MPRVSSAIRRARTFVIIVNTIILLCGAAILALGIFIEVSDDFSAIIAVSNVTQALGGSNMKWIGVMIIIAGISTIALAIFGCFAAAYKTRFFLHLYAILMVLIILLEFAAVIVALQFRDDIWQSYDSGFEQVFRDAYRRNDTKTTNIIERLEREFRCCGVNSSTDYTALSLPIPRSCYPNQNRFLSPFNQGCATAVTHWVWDKSPIIVGVLGSILFLEIFAIISSVILAVSIGRLQDYEEFS